MKNISVKFLLASCCTSLALSSFAAEKVFPQLAKAPKIDGKVSAAEWQGAATYQLKAMGRTTGKVDPTTVYFGTNGGKLYAAFVCYDRDMTKVVRSWRTPEERDSAIWTDDFVELRFDPWNAGQNASTQRQIIINANGIVYDAINGDKSVDFTTDVQSFSNDKFWSVEVSIPLAELTDYTSQGAELWRIMLGRFVTRNRQASSITGGKGNGFGHSDHFATFRSGKITTDKPFTIVGIEEGKLVWRSENPAKTLQGKLEQLRFDGRIVNRPQISTLKGDKTEDALALKLHRNAKLIRFTVNNLYKYEWQAPQQSEQSRTVKITEKPLYKELFSNKGPGWARYGSMSWSHGFLPNMISKCMELGMPWDQRETLAHAHRYQLLLHGGAGLMSKEWHNFAELAPEGAKFVATTQYYGYESLKIPKAQGNRPILFDPQARERYLQNAVKFFKPYEKFFSRMSFGDEVTEHESERYLELAAKHLGKGTYPYIDQVNEIIKNKYGYGKFGIPESVGDSNVYRWIAFRNFVADESIKLHKELKQTINKNIPGMLIMSDDPMDGQGRIYDYTDFTPDVCDIMTNQLYPHNHADIADFSFTSKYLRDLIQVDELHPCFHTENYGATYTPLEMLEKVSQGFRGGANGLHWYPADTRGNRDKRSLESERYGAPERWQLAMALQDTVRTMPQLKFPAADCGVFVPVTTARSYVGANNRPVKAQMLHSLLELQSGAWFKYFNESSLAKNLVDISKYKAIFVPDGKYCDAESLKKLADYVKNGGTLVILDCEAFSFDAAANKLDRTLLPGLANAVKRSGDRMVKNGSEIFQLNRTPSFDLAAPAGAQTLLAYADGKPAAIESALGKGKVIVFGVNFAQRELVTQKSWQNYSKELVKKLQIKTNHAIWRFRFPKDLIAPEKVVTGRCISGNHIFFKNFLAYYGANEKVAPQAAYICTPAPDAPAEKMPAKFSSGKLFDRRTAYRSGNVDGVKTTLNDRIIGWQTNDKITIVFDLAKQESFDRMELFYAGAMRDATIYTSSDGKTFVKQKSFAAESKDDVKYGVRQKTLQLDKTVADTLKIKLELAPARIPGAIEKGEMGKIYSRDKNLNKLPWQKANFMLVEVELWKKQ
ncbi:MAG: hypothetical protein E7052_10135 [Lentisphaerae bacterium]|nr:hypothetical protein [Lentisphaerota bacterium]